MADAIVAGGKNGVVRRLLPTDKKFYVYVHSRLSTGEPFYIGKGNGKRARKRDGRTPHWKNIVKKEGGFHISFLVKGVDEEFAMLTEIEAIDLYRRRGCSLVNFTDGGEGITGMKFSSDWCARQSANRKGKPLSQATRVAALAFHLGSKHSPEHREKIAAKLRGKRRPQDVVKKIADGNRGLKRSAEARENIAKAHLGVVQTQDSIAKRIAALKNKSPAEKAVTSAKLSASLKEAWKTRKRVPLSEVNKKALSELFKGKKQSPETCAKKRVSQLARWARIKADAEN